MRFASALAITLIGCTTPVAVLVTLRRLGAEDVARRVAPFLVLAPAAIWVAVSADGVFAAVAAWGLAAVAAADRRARSAGRWGWGLLGGSCSGCCLLLSYGLLLLGAAGARRAAAGRSWRPLPAGGAGCGRARGPGRWRRGLPALGGLPGAQRPLLGRASPPTRPASYWFWGDLAALAISAGPALGAGSAPCWSRRGGDPVASYASWWGRPRPRRSWPPTRRG